MEMTSPGSSVMTELMKLTRYCAERIIKAVVASCCTLPLSTELIGASLGSKSVTMHGPMGEKVSYPLALVHCPSTFCKSRAETSFKQV